MLLRSCYLSLLASCAQAGSGPTAEDPRTTPQAAPAQGVERTAAAPIAEYVVEAFEDSKGVLWFGTMNKGVARYDGEALTYLTEKDGLCGETIVSVAEDKAGALWFAGHTGVCRYDGESFTRFFEREGSVGTDRKGNVIVSTNDAVYRFDGASFVELAIPLVKEKGRPYSIVHGRVTFKLADSRGDLWFGTDGYGALRYDGTSFTQYTKTDGLCSDTIMNIVEDRQGRIWFAGIQAFQPVMTGDGGVCRYDPPATPGARGTFSKFPDVAGLGGNDIYTIYERRSGDMWIGATGLGAYRYDGKTFTLFKDTDRPDLIVNFGLQAMMEDRHGTLWCGFSGGLFRFNGESFVHVGQEGPWK